jgi:hypothetical protein
VPCYRCGARQGDPAPGKPSPWHQGVVAQPPAGERQVLICPDCYPAAQPGLARCPGCGGTRLVKRLGQVECLACHLTRDALPDDPAADPAAEAGRAGPPGAGPAAPGGPDSTLAAEVASALDRILRNKNPGP